MNEGLRRAFDAFQAFRDADEHRAAGQLRQGQFFLTRDGRRFAPANRCLSWLDGIAYDQPAPSGRERQRRDRRLSSAGLVPVSEGDSRFDTLFDALETDCRSLPGGRGVDRHYGDDSRAGKVIWIENPQRTEVIAIMNNLPAEPPKGFHDARVWFVAHPDTGEALPAKIVWGLATGQTGSGFTAHQARDALRRLGFEVADLSQNLPIAEDDPLIEGGPRQVTRNLRERNVIARQLCIDHYTSDGRLACLCCDMDFAETYGPLGRGFIHVHHLDPLAGTETARAVSPEFDLVPVCPNCHAMIHHGGKNRSIAEIRNLLAGPRPAR